MTRSLVFAGLLLFTSPLLAADNPLMERLLPGRRAARPQTRLGHTGHAIAMDLAGIFQMSTCASNLPLYAEKYPNADPKDILQKMRLSNTEFGL